MNKASLPTGLGTHDGARDMTTTSSWSALGEYLQRDKIRLLPSDRAATLREQWQDIAYQEEHLDDAILIGLVGGTGVGKSTFTNALAGERVSRSSDRRPTTDRVVVYRHVNTEISGDVPTSDFAQPEVLHDNDMIEKVVLFDFPDFDSAEQSHTQIIRRYLPFLDVLLVMVDDVKYADRRLYDLLRTLDHDPQNIYVLLNKVDRLADRYGDRTEEVITELIQDLSEKLVTNSQLTLADQQKFPIAALAVLEAREQGRDCESMPRFAAVEQMLGSYREDKRRRAVKELNIDARKRDLMDTISTVALGSANQEVLRETRQLVQGWRGAMDEALQSVSVEILGESERRGLQGSRLRQVGPSWGLPMSLFFTLLGELRKRSSKSVVATEMGQRVRAHYRGFFEAVKNIQARFASEFEGSKIHLLSSDAVQASDVAPISIPELGQPLQQVIQQPRPNVGPMARLLAHVPALSTLGLAFWGRIYDYLDGETGILRTLFETVSPTFLIATVVGVLLVYAGTAFVIWLRETQRFEQQIVEAEEATREVVRRGGQDAIDALDADLNAMYEEYETLEKLLG